MDLWSRELWLTRLRAPRTGTLRRVAVAVCVLDALVIAVAPYVTPRAGDQRGLYATLGAALAVNAAVLAVSRGWPDRLMVALAVGVPNIVILALLMATDPMGSLPMLLLWSALASPYFWSRATALANLGGIAIGMAVVVQRSPDVRLSWLTWAVVVSACTICSITVRLIAEQNEAIVSSLSDQGRRDQLTGLLSRRGFDERLDELWTGAGHLAVVFFDLDHFKIVNDIYGHPVGDAVVREFSQVLRAHVRDGDVVSRTGGEEFGVVMPGRGATGVLERARSVVEAFASTRIPAEDVVLRCTVSAGLAVREPRHAGASHLCRDADRALYMAKEAGRNRAVVWRVQADVPEG